MWYIQRHRTLITELSLIKKKDSFNKRNFTVTNYYPPENCLQTKNRQLALSLITGLAHFHNGGIWAQVLVATVHPSSIYYILHVGIAPSSLVLGTVGCKWDYCNLVTLASLDTRLSLSCFALFFHRGFVFSNAMYNVKLYSTSSSKPLLCWIH